MRVSLSKIRTAIDQHVDLRSEWPAFLFASAIFAAGLGLAFTMPVGR